MRADLVRAPARGASISGLLVGLVLLVLDLLRGLPEEQVGADGGAEDRDDHDDVVPLSSDSCGTKMSSGHLAPRHVDHDSTVAT